MPHELSATIEVVNQHEQLLGAGRFTTDRAGYTAMRSHNARLSTTVIRLLRSQQQEQARKAA